MGNKGDISFKRSGVQIDDWSLQPVFLERIIERLLKDADEKLKEGKKTVPSGIRLVLSGTKNIGTLEIDKPRQDNPEQRDFIVYVVREGTDRAYNHYLKDGTYEEIKEYLLSDAGYSEIYNSLHELSDKVDDYWD